MSGLSHDLAEEDLQHDVTDVLGIADAIEDARVRGGTTGELGDGIDHNLLEVHLSQLLVVHGSEGEHQSALEACPGQL